MSESEQENLYQAMDRLIKLAKVIPKTRITLVEWPKPEGFTVFVGDALPVGMRVFIRKQGRIVIDTTWEELCVWYQRMDMMDKVRVKDATDS